MIERDLPPLEWKPDELDPKAVALIRARFPKPEPNPVAELEEQLREELKDLAA